MDPEVPRGGPDAGPAKTRPSERQSTSGGVLDVWQTKDLRNAVLEVWQ